MKKIMFLGTILFWLVGCSTTFSVKKYNPVIGEMASGVIFYLPKTELFLDFKYTIYQYKVYSVKADGTKGGLKSTSYEAVIESPISLENMTVADYDNAFIFDVEASQSLIKDTNVTLEMQSSGVLISVNATTTDKASEGIKSTLDILTNVAKIAAVGGADIIEKKKVTDLPIKQRVDFEKLLAACGSNMSCSYVINTSAMSFTTKDCQPLSGNCGVKPSAFPKPKLAFNLQEKASTLSSKLAGHSTVLNNDDLILSGFPYRQSRQVHTSISIEDVNGNITKKDSTTPILQLGNLAYIPFESDAFESTDQTMTFDTTTGSLIKYEDTSNANAVAALTAGKEATDSIVTSLETLQTYKLAREKAVLDAKKELVDSQNSLEIDETEKALAQTSLLEQQKKLLDAQKVLDDAKALSNVNTEQYRKQQLALELELLIAEESLKNKKEGISEATKLQNQLSILQSQIAIKKAELELKALEDGE